MKSFILTSLIYGIVVFVWMFILVIQAVVTREPIKDISIPIVDLLIMYIIVFIVIQIFIGIVASISSDKNDKDNDGTNTPASGSANYQTM